LSPNTDTRLILDHVYAHEAAQPDRIFLTQPTGQGQAVDYTWGQTLDQARRMATHLLSLNLPQGACVAVLAKNSAHFFMAELAVWMAGATTVAIFPTETADNVRYVLQHCNAQLLFIGKLDTWDLQKGGVPDTLRCISLPLAPDLGRPACETWDAITARTAPLAGRPPRAATDLAMLLYTSGSTGQPKGVMQNFGAITAATQCILADQLQRDNGVELDTRIVSYLPLAHCFERAWVECTALINGHVHVYFTESLATFMADIQRARPTWFISVPRLWTKFQQGVLAKMPQAQLDAALANPAIAAAVGKKVLAGLGLEHVRRAGSGSAPMPAELLTWFRRLGLELYEGYAMTEDFAVSHTGDTSDQCLGTVGRPFPGVQARIAADGEVLVKSPGQMAGYYKQPELNAESFTPDGYFHTGDLGRYDVHGQLVLTGRKKELFKTAKGKYVAPAPIESRLNAHPMVESSMVSGVGQPAAYAMLQLDEFLRPRLDDPAVRAEVEAALTQLLHEVNAQVAGHEHLQMLVVARTPWTMESGTLTPTMKIKRARIEAEVAPALDAWYRTSAPVVWA
jgi:long-chain acyl-CoA synthetase